MRRLLSHFTCSFSVPSFLPSFSGTQFPPSAFPIHSRRPYSDVNSIAPDSLDLDLNVAVRQLPAELILSHFGEEYDLEDSRSDDDPVSVGTLFGMHQYPRHVCGFATHSILPRDVDSVVDTNEMSFPSFLVRTICDRLAIEMIMYDQFVDYYENDPFETGLLWSACGGFPDSWEEQDPMVWCEDFLSRCCDCADFGVEQANELAKQLQEMPDQVPEEMQGFEMPNIVGGGEEASASVALFGFDGLTGEFGAVVAGDQAGIFVMRLGEEEVASVDQSSVVVDEENPESVCIFEPLRGTGSIKLSSLVSMLFVEEKLTLSLLEEQQEKDEQQEVYEGFPLELFEPFFKEIEPLRWVENETGGAFVSGVDEVHEIEPKAHLSPFEISVKKNHTISAKPVGVHLEVGDVIVTGVNGFFDNMFAEDLCLVATACLEELAEELDVPKNRELVARSEFLDAFADRAIDACLGRLLYSGEEMYHPHSAVDNLRRFRDSQSEDEDTSFVRILDDVLNGPSQGGLFADLDMSVAIVTDRRDTTMTQEEDPLSPYLIPGVEDVITQHPDFQMLSQQLLQWAMDRDEALKKVEEMIELMGEEEYNDFMSELSELEDSPLLDLVRSHVKIEKEE